MVFLMSLAAAETPPTVPIASGTTMLGSETSSVDAFRERAVTFSKGFAMMTREVTQAEFQALMGSNPNAERKPSQQPEGSCAEFLGVSLLGGDHPVTCVSWFDAVAFANALSRQEGLDPAYAIDGEDVTWDATANGYRLPTDAEWEYAARAKTSRSYGATETLGDVCRFANLSDKKAMKAFGWTELVPDHPDIRLAGPCDDGFAALAPAGSLEPNPWGLHGMFGNAGEWVWDWDGGESRRADATDPRGPATGRRRRVHVGSFQTAPFEGLAWTSEAYSPTVAVPYLGFRLVRTLPE